MTTPKPSALALHLVEENKRLREALRIAERNATRLLSCEGFNDPNLSDGPAYGPAVHVIQAAARTALAQIK